MSIFPIHSNRYLTTYRVQLAYIPHLDRYIHSHSNANIFLFVYSVLLQYGLYQFIYQCLVYWRWRWNNWVVDYNTTKTIKWNKFNKLENRTIEFLRDCVVSASISIDRYLFIKWNISYLPHIRLMCCFSVVRRGKLLLLNLSIYTNSLMKWFMILL